MGRVFSNTSGVHWTIVLVSFKPSNRVVVLFKPSNRGVVLFKPSNRGLMVFSSTSSDRARDSGVGERTLIGVACREVGKQNEVGPAGVLQPETGSSKER